MLIDLLDLVVVVGVVVVDVDVDIRVGVCVPSEIKMQKRITHTN